MDDAQAIRDLVRKWMSATKVGDLSAVLNMMTDDVIFMVPGQEPFGKEQFAANSERLKNKEIEGTADIREIEVLGDWAYLRCYIEVTMVSEAKTPERRSGYTLTILRKNPQGNWVIARDANLVA